MSSSSEISHKGRVVSVTPEVTTVEIVSESACGACHAKGLCSLGDSKVKMVEVPTSGWSDIRPGDEVEVVLKASMGHKAVLLAYMIPLVLLVAVLLVAVSAGVGELYAGLAAIAAVAVYYFGLWLMRGRLRNEYIFNIKK
ncbi:MAG: SoxR reducing system RseC family protein [Bacteroidetes bacterium]|uniref:SoxR reducing system RseC family protein n=1 Tax=Candidatus Cryptobacteroides avistercoris TaxID=2840758 RepID=A0A9D9NNU9_9BACT|nr:SoxR reducing system RseC family protein [Candidatus Cryptobacteroides avistercoris]